MTNPHPQEKARSLRNTFDRWDDELSTVEITKPAREYLPVPDETRYWDEEEEEEE